MWSSFVNEMPPRLSREFQDKRLRVEFIDGQIAEIRLLLVSECDQHKACNGIVYDIISSNRPDLLKPGSAYWADIAHVKSFEFLGD
jgi:hypothetical protein